MRKKKQIDEDLNFEDEINSNSEENFDDIYEEDIFEDLMEEDNDFENDTDERKRNLKKEFYVKRR